MEEIVKWIVKNWKKIDDKYKVALEGKIDNAKLEDRIVVLLLDRQKPSVERSYDFDEERIGVNKDGKIIWGFDSGCSCPSPWEQDRACYSCGSYKEFEVSIKDFDKEWLEDCTTTLEKIKSETSNV